MQEEKWSLVYKEKNDKAWETDTFHEKELHLKAREKNEAIEEAKSMWKEIKQGGISVKDPRVTCSIDFLATKKQVTARDGKVFEVDISDEACGKFGFKHGDEIICTHCKAEGTVVGVTRGMPGVSGNTEFLWLEGKDDNGRVSQYSNTIYDECHLILKKSA